MLVQSEGGRIVKSEDWIVGLQHGEFLSDSVSVHAAEEEGDEPDPTAASSHEGNPARTSEQAHTAQMGGGEQDRVDEGDDLNTLQEEEQEWNAALSTLPVTGGSAPSIWMDMDMSKLKDLPVDEFMQTPLADFYRGWKANRVTCRLVGARFGYELLSRFFPRTPFEDDDTAEGHDDGEDCAGSVDVSVAGVDDDKGDDDKGEEGAACDIVADGTGSSPIAVAHLGDPPGPTSHTPAASSSDQASESGRALTGSRQMSLSHWLL